jgi:hypothetical protein
MKDEHGLYVKKMVIDRNGLKYYYHEVDEDGEDKE